MSVLGARDLEVHFGARCVLRVSRIHFEPPGLVGLIGANGAGKTTLLRALAGLVAHSGQVRCGDVALEAVSPRARARTLAYLPQNATAHWPLSVAQLVALGRLPHRGLGRPLDAEDHRAIRWAMAAVDVAHLRDRAITALSGGERARVLLARSLAVRAPVLMVDEPVASLDPYHQLLIMEVLADYARQSGLVIGVLHDLNLAARFCARLVLVHEGRIAADGPPAAVLTDDALARCYHVEVVRSEHQGPVIVPVARVPPGDS